jgi:hypothetical protein
MGIKIRNFTLISKCGFLPFLSSSYQKLEPKYCFEKKLQAPKKSNSNF